MSFQEGAMSKGRKTFKKNKGGKLTLKKVAKQVKKLAVNNKPEVKVSDQDISTGQQISIVPTIYVANQLGEGDDYYQRDGIRVRGKSIHIKGYVAVGDTTNIVRIIVYVAKKLINGQAVATTIADLFGTNTASVYDMFGYTTKDNYKVLADMRSLLTSVDHPVMLIDRYIKIPSSVAVAEYYNSSNTATNIVKNALHVAFISDSVAVIHPDFSGFIRYTFTDV